MAKSAQRRRTNVIIYGASGHGKVIAEMINGTRHLRLLGFIDDAKWSRGEKSFFGRPILGGVQYIWTASLKAGTRLVMGIGDNALRRKIAKALEGKVQWTAVVDAHALVSKSAMIGEGSVIMPGAIITADAVVGKHVIVNTGSTIDHDCDIGNYCHVAPGAHLAGGVRVGEGALIGIGSSVRQSLVIGRRATIGAGSVVVADIPGDCVAFGVPAKATKAKAS